MVGKGVLQRIRDAVGPQSILDNPADIAPFLGDARQRYRGRSALVLRPGSVEEVSSLLAICNQERIGVVPHGGNTGYCGGSVPDTSGDQLVLSLARLNRIRSVDAPGYSITVEAGCVLQTLQNAAAAVDRYFPLSLGAEGSCQIGGNLSTNAGGTAVLRYGMARDLVLGLEVVLPDGRILDMLRSLRKDNTGYDLKSLFVGAEGTLGVITAATMKLFPKVASRSTAYLAIDSLHAAVELLAVLRAATADRLTACEVLNRTAAQLVTKHIQGSTDPFSSAHEWHLLVEIQSSVEGEDLDVLLEATLAAAAEAGLVLDAVIAKSEAQRRALWRLRETIPEATAREGAQIKHDISVPIASVPDFVREAVAWVSRTQKGARLVVFGHIGDGNIHFNVCQPHDVEGSEFLRGASEMERAVHDVAHAFGGSFSAEHGIGQYKVHELVRFRTAAEIEVMRSVKRALDPNGIMNPGKILEQRGRKSYSLD